MWYVYMYLIFLVAVSMGLFVLFRFFRPKSSDWVEYEIDPSEPLCMIVRKVFANNLCIPLEKVCLDTPIDTLNIDSLGMIEIELDLDSYFDFMPDDEWVDRCKTLGDFVRLYEEELAKRNAREDAVAC